MTDPIFFAPLRVPVIDSRTGLMSREWYLFFQAMYLRVGGTSAPTNDDLQLTSDVNDATDDGSDLRAAMVSFENTLALLEETQPPTDLSELQALSASFSEDPIIARFTAQWDGLTPASGGGAVKFLRADGSWAIPPGTTPPIGANPTASVGLAAVNGVAATFMTSDSAPPLSQAIVPTWTGLHSWSQNLGAFSATGNPMMKLINTSATAQTPVDFFSNTATLTGRIRNDFAGNMNFVSLLSGIHSFWVGGDSGVGVDSFEIKSGKINLANHATTAVAPAAGAAGALPATPAGYVTIQVAGTDRKLAFY
jgi:hypothetical protein